MTEHAIKLLTRETMNALKAADRSFDKHSIFSPSGSHTWAYCSGSLIPGLFASDTGGKDAAYGTVAHGIGEQWLKTGLPPTFLIGDTEIVEEGSAKFEIAIDAVMFAYVEEYVDWCIHLPGDHFVECYVDHSDLTPLENQGGTADHVACEPGHMVITDLKMGKGVQVFAQNNTQALLYAHGFFRKYDSKYDFQRITIRICQPRLGHFDVWEIDRAELLKWAAWLKKRAYAAWCKDAARTPGTKQCEFCKIKHECLAIAVLAERVVRGRADTLNDPIDDNDMLDFANRMRAGRVNMQPKEIGNLTLEQKVALSRYKKLVESFFSAIHEDLEARIMRGETVPGKKVVAGRSSRSFKSEERAIDELSFYGLNYDVICPRTLISPAQSEEALMKIGYKRKQLPDLLASVIDKSPGKPTMVDEDDPRPPLCEDSGIFENLDDEL